MSLDLKGFVTPADDFKGLHTLAKSMEARQLREEQTALRQQQLEEQRKAKRSAGVQWMTNYLDPKQRYTGTKYDEVMLNSLSDAKQQAYRLFSKGAAVEDVAMAIGPMVDQVNQYQASAKQYQAKKKELLEQYSKQGGFNLDKVSELLDEYTFKNDKGEYDIANADPSLQRALKKINENNLDEITNLEDLNKWASKFQADERKARLKVPDKMGNYTISDLNVKAPAWTMPYKNPSTGEIEFVPQYDIASDGNNPIKHKFKGSDGKEVEANVHLLDEGVFQNAMQNSRSFALKVKGHVQKALQSGEYKDASGNPISFNHPQAELLGRAFAYDVLKPLAVGSVASKKEQTISMPQIRINAGNPAFPQRGGSKGSRTGSGANGEVVINDLSGDVRRRYKEWKGKSGDPMMPLRNLDQQAKDIIMKAAFDSDTDFKEAGQDDFRVIEGDDGSMRLFGRKNKTGHFDFVTLIDEKAMDVKVNRKDKATTNTVLGKHSKGNPETKPQEQPKSLAQRMREQAAAKNK